MITLESTKIAFDTWRATKVNNNASTPTELWDMVRQSLLTYKRAEICKVLGISGSQIKKHCSTGAMVKSKNVIKKSQPLQSIGNDFVEAIPASNTGMSELTLKGNSKVLHLCLPTSALRDVLPMLGELL